MASSVPHSPGSLHSSCKPHPLDHIALYDVDWPVMGHKGSHARAQLARCSTNDLYMQSPIFFDLIMLIGLCREQCKV
jgi:hypothetical protein